MHEEFWRERWERQEIAFHQREVNPRMRECWDRLGLARGDPVLVPLCGKSGDMWLLRTQGHPVLGVELSSRAAAAFYAEHGLAPKRRREGLFEVFEADGVRILCGNVFDLTADELAGVRGVYGRIGAGHMVEAVSRRRGPSARCAERTAGGCTCEMRPASA